MTLKDGFAYLIGVVGVFLAGLGAVELYLSPANVQKIFNTGLTQSAFGIIGLVVGSVILVIAGIIKRSE